MIRGAGKCLVSLGRRWTGNLLLAAGLTLTACGSNKAPLPPPVPEPATDTIDFSLFLIGDAGEPEVGGDPVLHALRSELSRASPSAAVFLGDNVYPAGIPDSTSRDRQEMERRLDDQIEAVLRAGGRAIFLPGNHDWAKGGADGWNAVLRQERHIERYVDRRVVLLPGGGCPGPAYVDLGTTLRVVIIDTQWWLHGNEKPQGESSGCPTGTRDEMLDSLRTLLAVSNGRKVVVAAHHPLLSTGPHGGHFPIEKHIFPLTDAVSWLYLPLPIIGSIYPIVRQNGISNQDLSGSKYREMREALETVLAENPPLIYAAGHEHTLEVLKGGAARFYLVSGAGYYGHKEPTGWRDETLFSISRPGFIRLDALTDGRVRLGVHVVDDEGKVEEPYSTYLASSP